MAARRARKSRPMGVLAQSLYGVSAPTTQPLTQPVEPAPAARESNEPYEPLTLTIGQAARRIGVSRTTLYPHVMNGTLPSVALGSKERKVLTSALPAFLQWLWEQQREELAG